MSRPVLYEYWRSSASYRVRIALKLKNVEYESRPVNLLQGEQTSEDFRAMNPLGLVPMLEIDGHKLTQSLAIINYLDIRYPVPPLIPASAAERAHVVAMCMTIACDIHPLQNLRVNKYLEERLDVTQEQRIEWDAHWIEQGFDALEAMAKDRAGKFLFGNGPSGADVCLVPMLYNARRYGVRLDGYPTLLRAEDNANNMEAFAAAHPDRQKVPA
jgi:maleylacetoacetate isomerase